jgi:threonylcarbamoyladenosine tRNA methylthiotransferase MtaB
MLVERDGLSGRAENFAALSLCAPAAAGTIIPVRIAARIDDRLVATEQAA